MLLDGLHNGVKYSTAMAPKDAVTDTTAFVSAIVDTANFLMTEFIGVLGTNADTDMTLTVLVEDGNNSSLTDNAAVADEYLLGIEAMGLNYASDDKCFKIGYTGPKRYVRVTVTPANNTGNQFLAAVWAQSGARVQPQSTQVV